MKVQLTTIDKKKYEVVLNDFPQTSSQQRFQDFLVAFKVSGFYLVKDRVALLYHSVLTAELVEEKAS